MAKGYGISISRSNTEEVRVEGGGEKVRTLGDIRLRDHNTQEIILIPTPSNDPNDPLNWSQAYKYYMACVVCMAMLVCNFLAAGPSIAILQTSQDFFPTGDLDVAISRVAFFFTTTSLSQGVGNFVWMPLVNKYGRRPVYITSYAIYFACTIWLIFERSYGGFLAGRIILGFGSGAAETMAPISIADVFFLHERGTIMSLYTSFLSIGVSLGLLIDGFIVIHNDWRVIYQVASALVGLVWLLAIFTFPETAYKRDTQNVVYESEEADAARTEMASQQPIIIPEKESYLSSLKIYHRKLTEESLLRMAFRPLGLICLPPILWTALVQSVTIGFLVAVTSNVASAFQKAYNFESWQVGLCFVAAIIGSIIGIPAGGRLGDLTADFFTKRNGGIRNPEMRLPAMMLCLIATPLALVLYGVGIEKRLHWICPTIGLGLLNFAITQGNNVCLVYVIDAYRPIAGEITLTILGFKAMFGFLLSFYTNPWVQQSGYLNAYGTMAAISGFIILMWIPLYIWGKTIRHVTWNWRLLSYFHWDDDREVGE
ncbi:major facilitator superfamily domain-containing protein [Biscogniauxia sp. FL1348]|nr:major facilitator superfamily domain-containing protein [Biscogniauxia sp. FL1348]